MHRQNTQLKNDSWQRGFTLVEMLVAVFIFSMVMMIAVGSLLSIVEANRKAQALKSVVNNLSFALDAMGRTIRNGSNYHCGSSPYTTTLDCNTADGGTELAFEPFGGDPNSSADQIIYRLTNGRIERSLQGGAVGSWQYITAPEVVIQDLRFYVVGSAQSETPKIQPKIVMVLRGYAGANLRTRTEINLQTTMTSRLLDE